MQTPHEALAEELGHFANGIRRELRESRDLALAEMRAAVAELRLAVNERLAGLRDGQDGRDGKDGANGRDGADGAVGPPGAIGEPGPEGPRGMIGANGIDGKDGRDGVDGAPGPQGPAGERGEPGEPGPPGPPAYVGEARGLFDEAASYRALDRVAMNGSEWIARVDNPGPLPGDGWMLSAKVGAKGERGDRGPRGEPGPAGASLAAVSIDDWSIRLDLTDGKRASVDLWPLFERFREEAGL